MRTASKSHTLTLFSLPLLFILTSACSEPSSRDTSVAPAESPAVDLIAHGAYLGEAVAGCFGCHSPAVEDPEATEFPLSGNASPEFTVPNITQDVEFGIGSWSDADIENALRKGKRPDGSDLHPVMPWRYYAKMPAEDMAALIAWLKSQAPVPNSIPKGVELPFPPTMFGMPPDPITSKDPDDPVARGSYLVSLSHCFMCHTAPGPDGVQDFDGYMAAGGLQMGNPDAPYVSANLTPHPEDGIAHYSDAELASIIKTGKRPDGSELAPIMGGRPGITDGDLQAIVAYLRTLPSRPYPDPPDVSETSD